MIYLLGRVTHGFKLGRLPLLTSEEDWRGEAKLQLNEKKKERRLKRKKERW